MGTHAIKAFVPRAGIDVVESWLETALVHAGRPVGTRHLYPVGQDGPPWRDGVLHWEVVELFSSGSTVLRIYDDAMRWDPNFLRALSALSDGFTQGLEHHRGREHYKAATMFAGRTLELIEYEAATGVRGVGYPPEYEFVNSLFFDNIHKQRFVKLCDIVMTDEPWETRVVAAGEWEVGPAHEVFSTDGESSATRVLFAFIDESTFRAALPHLGARGWRWRAFETNKVGSPCIEVARDGALDRILVGNWARMLNAAYVAFEVPGGGRPMPYAQGFVDGPEMSGEAVGTEQLLQTLIQITGMYGEGIGMMFSSGNVGWNDIS